MKKRDKIAMEVLKVIITSRENDHTRNIPRLSGGLSIDRSEYAKTAYQYADAMLKERRNPK